MDVFDDIINVLNLKGALYFRTHFNGEWGIEVPQYEEVARFHLLVKGHCFVQANGKTVLLEPGDMVLIPHGAKHVLSSTETCESIKLDSVLEKANYDGNGVLYYGKGDPNASTQLICGHFNFRTGADHILIRSLPQILYICNVKRAKNPLVDDLLRLITRQVYNKPLGSDSTIIRLTEIVFVELLKIMANEGDNIGDIFQAFSDPKISKSLQLIHHQPECAWTVESLAKEVAMSRSRFAKKFNDLLGTPPMTYLSEWRLQKAMSLLEESQMNIQEIASKTGYHSPSAFTRAFSVKTGSSPSDYRKSKIMN